MSVLNELLAAVGVGSARLELQLESGVLPRGGAVLGSVRLLGGEVSQHIESLKVSLEELVQQGKSSSWESRDDLILAVQFDTLPGQLSVQSFRMRIPDDANLSQQKTVQNWRVYVAADIQWAVNPHAGVYVEVVPHYEVTAVQRSLERMGFVKTGLYVDFAIRQSPDTVVRYYKAPPNLREQIDGASLHLRVLGAYVHGRIILNRRQHNVGEHLLALVGADREEYPLQIARQLLLNSKGGVNSRGAAPALEAILSRALVLPENANQKTLLRPSSGPPAQSDSLLRPASSSGSEQAPTLLRPLGDDQ